LNRAIPLPTLKIKEENNLNKESKHLQDHKCGVKFYATTPTKKITVSKK